MCQSSVSVKLLPMTARAVALDKFFFVVSITSKPLPSRLHLFTVPLAELIQYNLLAGKSIERPKAGGEG